MQAGGKGRRRGRRERRREACREGSGEEWWEGEREETNDKGEVRRQRVVRGGERRVILKHKESFPFFYGCVEGKKSASFYNPFRFYSRLLY